MTIRQQIHNLFYGENSRQENRRWHYAFMTERELVAASALLTPDPNRVWGIDIAGQWDGVVNLSVTKSLGANFVFIKGLDGTVRVRCFTENRTNAIAASLLHAPYLWLYPDNKVPCKAQAAEATKLLQQYPADLPAMLDFEWTKYAGEYANPNYSDLDKWATEFLRLGNRKPLLYSAPGYMDALGKIPDSLKAKFSGIAIAHYGVIRPTNPIGYLNWEFWQLGVVDSKIYAPNNNGKLETDLDYWHSDVASLYAFAGSVFPEEEEEPMAEVIYYADLLNGQLSNVRSGIGLTATILQTLTGPLTISITGEKQLKDGYYWVPISVPVAGYVALTSSYANFRSATPDEKHTIEITVDGKMYLKIENGDLTWGG